MKLTRASAATIYGRFLKLSAVILSDLTYLALICRKSSMDSKVSLTVNTDFIRRRIGESTVKFKNR
jgi:hypothetical protein